MVLDKSVTSKRTIEMFKTLEQRFNTVHGNKYDYSEAVFVTSKTKLIVICPKHGKFYQNSNNHLQGKGCRKCGHTTTGNHNAKLAEIKRTLANFKVEATKVHGTKYSYKYVTETSMKTNGSITIVCPIHGNFDQSIKDHLRGRGCKLCANHKLSMLKTKTTEQFIKDSKNVHGDTYSYSAVDYQNSTTKVPILCVEHGTFMQEPSNHLMGKGCPSCATSGFQLTQPAILYYFKIGNVWKVGITNSTITKRYYKRDRDKMTELQERHYLLGADALAEEQRLLKLYSQYKYTGPTPFTDGTQTTECFTHDIMQIEIKD